MAAAAECFVCGTPTTKPCSGCSDDPRGETTPTHYCSRDCQTKDWPAHKETCQHTRARKQLYRGAALAQDLFFVFRETLWEHEVKWLKVDGQEMTLQTFDGDQKMWPLCPFPDGLVATVEVKRALLSMHNCGLAVGYMHDFFQQMFKGKHDYMA
jgi:hypothetical protein